MLDQVAPPTEEAETDGDAVAVHQIVAVSRQAAIAMNKTVSTARPWTTVTARTWGVGMVRG